MVSKNYTALLVYKIEFSNPCHALKNSVAVKGLNNYFIVLTITVYTSLCLLSHCACLSVCVSVYIYCIAQNFDEGVKFDGYQILDFLMDKF